MPIRRCQRLAEKKQKKTAQVSSEIKSANSIPTSKVNKTEGKEINQLETQSSLCIACKSESPKIKRYTEEPWIQCDVCKGWWHLECACLTPESVALINKRKLYFPCALCVVKNLQCTGAITQNDCSKTASIDKELNCVQKNPKLTSCNEKNNKPIKSVSFSDQVIIIDNIENPASFSNSKKISEKLKSSEIAAVEFAYPLVKGGVALHFKDSQNAQAALENWPGKVFGEKESVHRPRGQSGVKVGYMKNIDPRYSKNYILKFLEEIGCKVRDVRRCYHRGTGRPMPVVKIFHNSHEDLLASINTDFGVKFNGKKTYVEAERQRKVVRCYNCMRFGHIGSSCLFTAQCENCGGDHTDLGCSNKPNCFNCGGQHKASSSTCPVFLSKLKDSQLQNIL